MNRDETLEIIRKHKSELAEKYGVTSIGVFGSVARDEATDESDVDVVVEMTMPDLFSMVHIKELLENATNKRVDVVRFRDDMNPRLRRRIIREAHYV
jgi:hypothetical protein